MQVQFNDRSWKVRLYDESLDLSFIAREQECGMDTEFEVCDRGSEKKIVVMQVAWWDSGICDVVPWPLVQHYISEVERISSEAGNDIVWDLFPAGVDLDAVKYRENFLFEQTFRRDKYLVRDMAMRLSLYEQSIGQYKATLSLAYYTKKYLGVILEKDDEIRLNFRQDKPLTDEEIQYGGLDAIATLMLGRTIPEQPLEPVKTQGAVALHFCGERGYPADITFLKEQQTRELDDLYSVYGYLSDWGYWPGKIMTRDKETNEVVPQATGMSGGETELQKVLHTFEHRYGLDFKRTASKKKDTISLSDEDAERAFLARDLPVHPLIVKYKEFKHAQKMLSSYLKPELVMPDGKWHPRFNPMMKNGRTSATGPAIQTLPRKGGHRGIFCAAPGHLILAVDVCQAELCALAQANWIRFGKSRMRELINEDQDLHKWFAKEYICKRIYEKDWDLLTPQERDSMRKDAKPVNFGLPGGLGEASFQAYALNSWGREFDRDTIHKLRESWFEAYPETRDHLKPQEDEEATLRTMQAELRNYKIHSPSLLHTVEDICSCLNDNGWTQKEVNQFCFRCGKYQVTTFQGHKLRNCNFTDACNYAFSVPTADTMSDVLGESERLGLPLINFVHDEVHYHLPMRDEEKLQAQVRQGTELIRSITQKWIPDTLIKVEPALMRKWYKEAEPVWYEDGSLGVWEPPKAEEED